MPFRGDQKNRNYVRGTVMIPKKKEWLDGKQKNEWVGESDIGWVVCTAGWIDMTMIPSNLFYNYRVKPKLPPGYRMILKDIDSLGNAVLYTDDDGVVKMPRELVEPWMR